MMMQPKLLPNLLFQNGKAIVVKNLYRSYPVLHTVPKIDENITLLEQTVQDIQAIEEDLKTYSTNYTLEIATLRSNLIKSIATPLEKLLTIAKLNKNIELTQKASVKLYGLDRLGEEGVVTCLTSLVELIGANIASIVPLHYTADSFKALQAQLARLVEMIKERNDAKPAIVALRNRAELVGTKQREYLDNVLVLFRGVADVYRVEVNQIFNAIKIKPSRIRREVSISALITNHLGKLLNNVIVEFYLDMDGSIYDKYSADKSLILKEPLKPTFVKVTTSSGIFRCKNVKSGYYTVFVKMNGYETKVAYYAVNDHNLTLIELSLDPLPERLPC
ncbi:hypothetical protein [Alistipes sp. ZOR0009]|uniref:hypothetical protein n=1 Tax=Alistipes sp. ZOR0009 TaxID=1339253 RepID=UPI000646292D|nr:hypothetical protein [Alistipes sp. ZOR0009]